MKLLETLKDLTSKGEAIIPSRSKPSSERDIKSVLQNMAFQAFQTVLREASSQSIHLNLINYLY